MHVAVDEHVRSRVESRFYDPCRPVLVPLVLAHEVFFYVNGVGGEVADVVPFAVGYGADGVWGAFGDVVVHGVGELSVFVCFLQEDGEETFAVEFCIFGVCASGFDQCRQDVGKLDYGVCSASGFDVSGPSDDEAGVYSGVEVGPLVAGELGALFGGENDHCVLGLAALLEGLQGAGYVSVEDFYFGEVFGEIGSGLGCVG